MKADASLPQHIAIALIGGYQKHISPRKGFSCAHRLLHGGESCSQHIKRLIAQKGLFAAHRVSQRRFRACREANQILQARYADRCHNENNLEQENKRRRLPKGQARRASERKKPLECGDIGSCPGEGFADCVDLSLDLACDLPDCGVLGSDCSIPDCGSGLDCGTVDCGGFDACG